jgi:hypothetical protein
MEAPFPVGRGWGGMRWLNRWKGGANVVLRFRSRRVLEVQIATQAPLVPFASMALTASTRAQLKEFYNALTDRTLEPGDRAYVPEVNQKPTLDVIQEMANEVDYQEGGGVCLFTGQRGTGKSTELRRLKHTLENMGVTVVYADMSAYLLLSKEIEISDFLVSMAGALSEELEAVYEAAPGNRNYWERFREFLATKVEVKEITTKIPLGVAAIDLKAALKQDPDFKQRVQEACRGHIAQLIQEAHDFFKEAVQFVREKQKDPNRKLVLIVDSVERIRGVGSDAMKVYESVRSLFLGQAEALRIPMLHVVYTVPPYLSVLAAGAGSLMGGAVVRRLVSTHIFKDRSRDIDESGVDLLVRVITQRYAAWNTLISQKALRRLAVSSGGDLREFFRLVRQCLTAIQEDRQLPLEERSVKPAENASRNEMLPIPADHLQWLKRIADSHDTCLASDDKLPILAHFLDNRLVLNYRNGTDWYDVHPLLRETVDSHDGTTA